MCIYPNGDKQLVGKFERYLKRVTNDMIPNNNSVYVIEQSLEHLSIANKSNAKNIQNIVICLEHQTDDTWICCRENLIYDAYMMIGNPDIEPKIIDIDDRYLFYQPNVLSTQYINTDSAPDFIAYYYKLFIEDIEIGDFVSEYGFINSIRVRRKTINSDTKIIRLEYDDEHFEDLKERDKISVIRLKKLGG